jgi:hypothetical protein
MYIMTPTTYLWPNVTDFSHGFDIVILNGNSILDPRAQYQINQTIDCHFIILMRNDVTLSVMAFTPAVMLLLPCPSL